MQLESGRRDTAGRGAGKRVLSAAAAVLLGAASALTGVCGPFTDVTDPVFCPFVLEIFTLGITTGTSPTTYDPASNVTRLQMAAFLSRTVDRALQRENPRTSRGQFWTPQNAGGLGLTTVGARPVFLDCDGTDVWVASLNSETVSRVRASDGSLLETWSGAASPTGILATIGSVFVISSPGTQVFGRLYRIDPSQPAGGVTTIATNLGIRPSGLTFDGGRIWTANVGQLGGSVSIVTLSPVTVTTVSVGASLTGAVFDGLFVWVTDGGAGNLLRLDGSGAIAQTVTVDPSPGSPLFDGTNIWIPNVTSNSVTVVRASSGAILATLTGNGLSSPLHAAFDGQRVLVTDGGAFLGDHTDQGVSLWRSSDLAPIGFFSTGTASSPNGVRSDGVNFWIALSAFNQLARF